MSRLQTIGFSLVFFVILTGGNCSRARVESMTHMNAGVAAARTGRYADAKESLERAIALDATNDQAFFNLAIVHMEMSEWEVAEEHLSRAISVNPAPAGYHEKLSTKMITPNAQLFIFHYSLFTFSTYIGSTIL